jgi:Flp pilus assembly protein TadD
VIGLDKAQEINDMLNEINEKNDMDATIKNFNKYHYYILQAIDYLENKFFQEAESNIMKAISINYHAPEAHNLLGALSELNGELGYAGRHYLAANALDPTYLPAIRNLRRLTTYSFRKKPIKPDLGNNNTNFDMD